MLCNRSAHRLQYVVLWGTEWGKSTLRQVHPAKTQIILGSVTTNKALFFNQKLLIFFLFLHENICCGYSLEAPRQGTSNEYPQHMFSWRNIENIYMMTLLTGAIHILDVWSGPSVLVYYYSIWWQWFWKWATKALIKFCRCQHLTCPFSCFVHNLFLGGLNIYCSYFSVCPQL